MKLITQIIPNYNVPKYLTTEFFVLQKRYHSNQILLIKR